MRDTLESIESSQRNRIGELELAIHEVAINIVDHAFGPAAAGSRYTISVEDTGESSELKVLLRDNGIPFVAAAAPNLDEPQVRGYGLFIAEELTSSLSYERVDDTNIWTLTFAEIGTPQTQTQENTP